MNRRCARAAWVLLGLAFAGYPGFAAPVSPSPRPSPATTNPRRSRIVAPRATPSAGSDLYSRHARRMVQSYLRLRLLELREADLDRAREVLERRLGADALLAPGPLPSPARPAEPRER